MLTALWFSYLAPFVLPVVAWWWQVCCCGCSPWSDSFATEEDDYTDTTFEDSSTDVDFVVSGGRLTLMNGSPVASGSRWVSINRKDEDALTISAKVYFTSGSRKCGVFIGGLVRFYADWSAAKFKRSFCDDHGEQAGASPNVGTAVPTTSAAGQTLTVEMLPTGTPQEYRVRYFVNGGLQQTETLTGVDLTLPTPAGVWADRGGQWDDLSVACGLAASCCAYPLPLTLRCTIRNRCHFRCMDGLSFNLVYDVASNRWIGDSPTVDNEDFAPCVVNGTPVHVEWNCGVIVVTSGILGAAGSRVLGNRTCSPYLIERTWNFVQYNGSDAATWSYDIWVEDPARPATIGHVPTSCAYWKITCSNGAIGQIPMPEILHATITSTGGVPCAGWGGITVELTYDPEPTLHGIEGSATHEFAGWVGTFTAAGLEWRIIITGREDPTSATPTCVISPYPWESASSVLQLQCSNGLAFQGAFPTPFVCASSPHWEFTSSRPAVCCPGATVPFPLKVILTI